MNYKTLIAAVALIAVSLVVPFASAAPKAYDTVFYKGKAAGLKILFEFEKRSQHFIRVDNETLSVPAMRVSNEDCSPAGIHG